MKKLASLAVLAVLAGAWGLTGPSSGGQQDGFPPVVNTQNPNEEPPTAAEAARRITVPEGFRVTLFAGDPDVRQPIAMHTDDRGRLWVAESYTYAADRPAGQRWDDRFRDRVLVFEDTDNDGRFDRRRVFWDRARNLSSVATGFGGVWVLCAPHLLFLPDRDGDDVPDGEPEVVLDGWVVGGVGHNIVNGLTWGPDGWLYGRHGIQDTSRVGRPGTPDKERVDLNCGIWRYHPTRKVFEVVANGTTNPWGLDYDDHGQMFFTGNVNGHLWHVIPGAHYKRMYGDDFNPYLYGLIAPHADHDHYDSEGKSWTDSRDGTGKHGELGGGHSHCGAMIYLGDNWPDGYRNTIFMCNTHGRRVNNDILERKGCGYVGRHGKDFLFANNPWFRGVTILSGPDGGVYVSDWVDLGECHDHDGVHRTSGRVYKVTYGEAKKPQIEDVSKLADAELVQLQLHRNDWYVRAARRNLQERAAAGNDMTAVHAALRAIYNNNPDATRRLRALWALHVTGGVDDVWLSAQLDAESEHIRVWAIKLLVDDHQVAPDVVGRFAAMAKGDPSGLVRLFLASALQRLPVESRAAVAAGLLAHGEDAGDHDVPLMIWYGVEPLVPARPAAAVELARASRIPLVAKFIARRLTEDLAKNPGAVDSLVAAAADSGDRGFRRSVLQGMAEALKGWRKAAPPESWARLQQSLGDGDGELAELSRNLGVVFGDGRALADLQRLALDPDADGEARRAALGVLIENRPKDLVPVLKKLAGDRAMLAAAVKGLAAYGDPSVPELILRNYRYIRPAQRPEAMDALVSRPEYAEALLEAVGSGAIDRGEVSAYHARQIQSLKSDRLDALLSKVWGEVRTTPADRREAIERYKSLLTPERLRDGDAAQGRVLFDKNCATCHKLFGAGKLVGPDLTGGNRDSLHYLLENIIDPSAVVPVDFKMSVVLLKSGRVLNGVITKTTDQVMTVQTQNEVVTVPRGDVEEVQGTALSLMPEGVLTTLSEDQVRDLIAYLMSRQQVPLPEGESNK